jgi:hypothetical protein
LRLPQRADLLSLSDGLAFDIDTSRRLLMTLAVSRGFTPRATASVMMLVRSPRGGHR